MEEPTRAPRCSNCDAVLPPNASGLCAACAFDACADATSMPVSDSSSRLPFVGRIAGRAPDRGGKLDEVAGTDITVLEPGQVFGPYRVGRLLGRGGMGEVYEAEHLGHGRRVALKVLNQRLRRADDRERFLQEGQLAAAVNHPNTVYIFSSEEVDDLPVITMELLPGGTLKDRVKANGPLPPPEAVDAILQVIAGLEAAHAGGILHRDVKPSNCFVAADGTVKVGDFGLSISSLPRHVTTLAESGAFQGTPAFAAPEQLRGELLDLRADIYSVGATLFYLLTAHPPFEDQDRAVLVARDSKAPAPPARKFQPAIPRELDRLVTRCLAKQPDMRPGSYAEIARELTRLTSLVSTPASLGRRAAAGLLDAVALLPVQGLLLAPLVGFGAVAHQAPALAWAVGMPMMLYGTVAEAATGTTLGMRQCGLRAISANGGRPDFVKALVRNAVALIPFALALVVSVLPVTAEQSSLWHWLAVAATFVATTALLFMSARARNGLSAIHDSLSHTRIVLLPPGVERRAEPAAQARPAPRASSLAQIGPYDVTEALGPTDVGELFVGFDPRLKRSVWIHVALSDAPAVPAASPGAASPARLHWLSGQRKAFGGWDAYEVPAGGPLLSAQGSLPWRAACQALIDLTSEIDQCLRADAAAALSLDRVWLTPDGRLVLLDFRAPGVPVTAAGGPATVTSAQRILSEAGALALGVRAQPPLPLAASAAMQRLASASFATLADVAAALRATRGRPDHVSRALRCTALAVSVITWVIGSRVLSGVGVYVSPVGGADILCAGVAVAWAFALRSGFWLRIFGIAVVTADGREASRLRALGRAVLAWSWTALQVLPAIHGWWLVGGLLVLSRIAGLAWTAADPARGPHDVLAGTYLVPR